MATGMTRIAQFLDLWVIRIVVLSSLAAHLVLILFAGIRRRKAFGWRTILLWLAYQGGGWAATAALGKLTLGSTLREQQLVTFWEPFLLLHLGGPDNILSARQMVNVAAQVAGATYGLYKHIIIGSDKALLWASVIMFFFSVGKYVENALALLRGDMGSIRSSIKNTSSGFTEPVGFKRGQKLGNEQALLVAHSLLYISKGAFVDYLVKDINRERFSYGWKEMCKVVEMELSLMYDILYTKAAKVHTWFGYGIRVASPLATATALWLFCLYNKYGQRRVDVVITYILLVATFLLDLGWLLTALGSTWTYAFLNDRPGSWLHHQLLCTGRWHRFRRFIVSLDPCWLLAKKEPTSYRLWLGSIGQYNMLQECTHDTASLYRALAKKVGLEDRWMEYQYHYSGGLDILPDIRDDLFEQIWIFLKSVYQPKKHDKKDEKKDEKKMGAMDVKMDVKKKQKKHEEKKRDVKKESIVRTEFQEHILIWHIATSVFLLCRDQNAACTPQHGEGDQTTMGLHVEGDQGAVGLHVEGDQGAVGLHVEGDQGAVGLHVEGVQGAVGLHVEGDQGAVGLHVEGDQGATDYVKAIKALSDYMVFLVAVRPNMVPGPKLRSTYKATHDALEKIWHAKGSSSSSKISPSCTAREMELASILRNMENKPGSKQRKPRNRRPDTSLLYDWSIILSDGTKLAEELLKIAKNGDVRDKLSDEIVHFLPDLKKISGTIDMQKLLELIFKAWVRMLIFVSVRCSTDSHAKQLSRGGELTTIVWILAEHAGILRIRSH